MRRWVIMLILLALIGAACGDDTDDATSPEETPATTTDDTTDEAAEPTPAESDDAATDDAVDDSTGEDGAGEDSSGDSTAVDLTGVCPDPLVLQTDWFPSPEHGYAYRLIGDAGELDAENGIYRGPLLDTGIDLEIRAGGPYLGFQPGTSTLYVDQEIHLAYVSTDEAVAAYASDLPTVAVLAPLEINPQILMWNPEEYSFTSFEDIGESDATVLYFAGAAYVDYLVGKGTLRADQIDSGYDGSPARFVAENGALAQQGFATSEPYLYENELEEWGKPVDYLLVHDSGFEVYSQPLVVRTDALDELRPCLELVVPIFQQAVVDHYADPAPTDQVILDIVEELGSSWVLFPGQMEYSSATAIELGVVGNGPDDIVGNFDADRMTEVVDLLEGVLADIPDELTAEDLYTNEFVDPSIGF